MGKAAVAEKPKSGGTADAGMDRAELKKHVRFAREEPVQIAFAIGADGKAVLQMHRRKPGRALEKQIKEEAPDAKNHRWGTLAIDEENPKLAKVVVNKASAGMSRKLVLALKGTGCSKVQITLEDGTEVEAHEDEDGELEIDVEAPQAQHARRPEIRITPRPGHEAQQPEQHAKAAPAEEEEDGEDEEDDAEESPAAERPQAAQPDAKALSQALAASVKRMMEVIKHDPSQKAALVEQATDVQASLKRGDLDAASAGLDVFRMSLEDAAGGPAAPAADANPGKAAAPAAHSALDGKGPNVQPRHHAETKAGADKQPKQGNHGATHPSAPIIIKARSAWAATRQKLQAEVAQLSKQFEAAFTDHEMAEELVTSFKARVGSVLEHLDEALSHKLDEVNKAHDAAQRAKLVDEAHKVIARYSQHISSDPTIKELDDNPFVPMALAKTLTGTLSVLSKSIH